MDSVFPPAVLPLLDAPLLAYIATVSPSGRPQSAIVWFERRREKIVIFAAADSPKVRNLCKNPHIDVIVVDPERALGAGTPYYVRLTGTGEVRPREPGIEHRMARRYGHPDGYPFAEQGGLGAIVTIVITVERVSGLGPFGPSQAWVEAPATS